MPPIKPATSNGPTDDLQLMIDTAVNIISQGEDLTAKITLGHETEQDTKAADRPELDALRVANDSASLIRAHVTKLSLLMINEPYTPSAITKVLRDLVAGPIPALASATQICVPFRYTAVFRSDLAWRCGRLLKELKELVQKIPTDGKALSGVQKDGSDGLGGEKGSLAITGVIWAACDEVIRLTKDGIAAHLIVKVEQYRDTLKDVMEELKEWGEETEEGDDGEDKLVNADDVDGASSELAGSHSATQAMLDDLMNPHQHIPADDPDKIRERLDSCLRRIRLTTLLYQAIAKRRLKTLPPLPTKEPSDVCSRLDEAVQLLKKIPEGFDDVAAAFYELSPSDIDNHMDQRSFDAFAVSELFMHPWAEPQKNDEFTDWALKFQVQIKKAS